MLDNTEFENWVKSQLELLPISQALGAVEAEMRAAQLLRAVAFLASYRRSLMDQLAKSNSQLFIINSKTLSEIMPNDKKATVTEKKVQVQANPDVVLTRENTELLESNIKYLSTLIDIMNNGHLLLRQIAKGE